METENCRAVVDSFMAGLNALLCGEDVDPFSMLHDDVDYVRHGIEGSAVHCRGIGEVREKLFPPEVFPNIVMCPGSGLFPVEYIQEGNRLAVIYKGRGTMARGVPYNNTYLFFFEVKGGRVVRIVEDLDASISRKCLWDMHLEEADTALVRAE